jgi:nitric oxide dioxygenase
MTEKQLQLVQQTWEMVMPIADTAADLFYGKLFEIAPQVKPMFPEGMADQKKKLIRTITVAVWGLGDLETLIPVLEGLGRRHTNYGVEPHHYETVAEALLWTLEQGLGDEFKPEVKEAWVAVYTIMTNTMIDAAETVS